MTGYAKNPGSEKGISLVIVLWAIALLMAAALEFAYTLRTEAGAALNYEDELSAYYLASAGINKAVAEIAGEYEIVYEDGGGKLAFSGRDEHGVLKPNESERELPLGDGKASYEIEDERGKLNANTASWESFEALLKETGVEKERRDIIADSLMDWLDSNHEYRLNGAEDDYYLSLPSPHGAKDAPLDTVDEMLLIKGVDPEVFFGTGKTPAWAVTNKNTSTGRYEYAGFKGLLTVKGDGKININTAKRPVLVALLGAGKADEILLRRETERFFTERAFGGEVTSNIFSISSKGIVRGIEAKIEAVAEVRAGRKVVFTYWNGGGA